MQPLFSWLTILVLSPDLTKIFPFFGPPAVVGRFLENRVCLSFCPFFHQSGHFLKLVLETYLKLCITAECSRKNNVVPKIWKMVQIWAKQRVF